MSTFFVSLKFHYKLGAKSWCLKNEGKDCPVCRKASELWNQGKQEENAFKTKLATELFSKQRFFSPIVIAGQESDGPKVWSYSPGTMDDDVDRIFKTTKGKLADLKSGGYITITSLPKSKEYKFGKIEVNIDMDSWVNMDEGISTRTPLAPTSEEIEAIMNAVPNIKELFPRATEEDLIKAFNEFINSFESTGEESESDTGTDDSASDVGGLSEKPATTTKKKTAPVEVVPDVTEDDSDSLDMGDIEAQFKSLLAKG